MLLKSLLDKLLHADFDGFKSFSRELYRTEQDKIKARLKRIYQTEFDDLNNQIRLKDDAILAITNEKREAKKLVSALERQVSILTGKVSKLQSLNENLESSLKIEIDRLRKQIDVESDKKVKNWQIVESERAAHADEISRVTNEYNDKMNAVKVDLDREIEKNKLLTDECSQLRILNENLTISEKQHDDRSQQLADELDAKANEIIGLESSVHELECSLHELEDSKQLLQKQLSQIRQSVISEEVVAALRNDAAEKAATIRSLESEIQNLNEKISDHVHDNEGLKLVIEQEENRCRNIEKTLSDYAERMESFDETQRELDGARKTISDLQLQISNLPKLEDLIRKENEITKLKQKIDSLNEIIAKQKSCEEEHNKCPQKDVEVENQGENEETRLTEGVAEHRPIQESVTHITPKETSSVAAETTPPTTPAANQPVVPQEILKVTTSATPAVTQPIELPETPKATSPVVSPIAQTEAKPVSSQRASIVTPTRTSVEDQPVVHKETPKVATSTAPAVATQPTAKQPVTRSKKIKYPYDYVSKAPSKNVIKKDFPKIENDNVYGYSTRLIEEVFDCRTNSTRTTDSILMNWTAEQISRLSVDLVEARRKDEPYLVCPYCRQMLILSKRTVGLGSTRRDVQYFAHAVKNTPCELKRDYTPRLSVSGEEYDNPLDLDYAKEIRTLIYDSLNTERSKSKGVFDVQMLQYISSDELPIMKRRLADVVADYKSEKFVFELVTPSTNISKVHDKDLFFLINHIQVFWIFGLEAKDDYVKLRSSLAKDVLFTNKRNVFVFDIEAQDASRQRGELVLKCNWLDENNEWYYNHNNNDKNGELITLDQIKIDEDSCRPYHYDADEPYFLTHPQAERPAKLSREEVINNIKEAWKYEQAKNNAVKDMLKSGKSIEVYCEGELWGFKYGETIFIEPKFKKEPEIVGSFAKVENKGKYGVVNRFGEYSLQTEYDEIVLLENDQILYCDRDKWRLFGVIDELCGYSPSDEVSINTISRQYGIYYLVIRKFIYANQPAEEFYFIGSGIYKKNTSDGKWSLWQSKSRGDVTWDTLEITPDKQIKVSVNGHTQLLRPDGTVVEEQKYKTTKNLSNGNILFESFDGLWGMIGGDDHVIVEPVYSQMESLTDDYLKVCKDGAWGVCDATGGLLIEPQFRTVANFDGAAFTVTKADPDKSWQSVTGKVNLKGEPIAEIKKHIDNGTDISFSFERYGLQKDSNVLIPNMYTWLCYWGKDKYIAKQNDMFGVVSIDNKVLLPFEYQSISPLSGNRSSVTKGLSKYHIDENFNLVDDETINLEDGFKKVRMAGKWGIVNPQGDVIVDYKYDEITTFRGRLIGIINGKLVKLSAYYPHRLQMIGINASENNRDIVNVASVKFQLAHKRRGVTIGAKSEIVLVNWTYSMKYPMAQLNDKSKSRIKAKHVDRPDDYTISETYSATVMSFIRGCGKSRITKGVKVGINENSVSYVYKSDFGKANIGLELISVGTKLSLTKLGFDDELDRTIWKVKLVTE